MNGEILFLAHRTPWPPDRGDRIRSWHLLDALTRIAPVHLGCFADDDAGTEDGFADWLASVHVERRGVSRFAGAARALSAGRPLSLGLFDSAGMRRFVRRTLAERPIACVFAFSGQMAQFVPADVRARFVMDFVDVDSAKFESYAQATRWPMRWVHAREGRTLGAFEAAVARRADVSLFVSDAEAALFRARSGIGDGRVLTLENGTDLSAFDPDAAFARLPKAGALIVFTGQMDYRPNVEAVERFAREAMPLILTQRPDARFAIVGRDPAPAVRALSRLPGVSVTGTVADVRGWLAAADAVVAPLRIARGVQNKVLEAMAMARPVIVSPAALEGIEAAPGRELIVADGPGEEAEAVLALLADPDRAERIGRAARARVIARYGWEARLAALPEIVGMGSATFSEAAE